MLDNFMNSVKKKKESSFTTEEIDIFESPIFNPNFLKEKLLNIENIPEQELYQILKNNHELIVTDIFVNNCNDYLPLFTNSKFLSIMIQTMESIPNLSYSNKIYYNKIIYDYICSAKDNSYVKDLLFTLSKAINRDVIPGLSGLGLPQDLVAHLALAKHSSIKEFINVKRLNYVIITAPKDIMTEQMIVWIYEKLFDNFTILFEGTMFDVNTSGYTEEQMEIYSRISLAILDILENMPSFNIQKVLTSYANDYYTLFANQGFRFSMRSLSVEDYGRITNVVYSLSAQNIIYIP